MNLKRILKKIQYLRILICPGGETGRHARLKTCLPAGRSGVRKNVRVIISNYS